MTLLPMAIGGHSKGHNVVFPMYDFTFFQISVDWKEFAINCNLLPLDEAIASRVILSSYPGRMYGGMGGNDLAAS